MPLHRRQILAVTLFLVTGSVTCQDVSSSTTNSPAPLPTTQQTVNKTDSGSGDSPSTSAPTVTPAIETSAVNTEQLQNTTTTTTAAAGSTILTNTTKAESVTDIGNVTTITTETGNSEVSTEAVTSPPAVEDGTEATNVTAGQAFLAGKVDLQTQVYIISGTFGLVAFLLIVLLLSLALSVSKIKEQILDSESRYVVEREDRIAGYQNGGYSSGQVSSRYQEERSVDGDLKNMGYSIYSGNNRNREENIPMQNVRSNNMMKYEEGVIPMAEEEDDR